MKKLSKKELESNAKHAFDYYPKENVLLATEDGNIFLKKNEHDAKTHARKSNLELFEFHKETPFELDEDEVQANTLAKLKKDELIKLAAELAIETTGKETNKQLIELIQSEKKTNKSEETE